VPKSFVLLTKWFQVRGEELPEHFLWFLFLKGTYGLSRIIKINKWLAVNAFTQHVKLVSYFFYTIRFLHFLFAPASYNFFYLIV